MQSLPLSSNNKTSHHDVTEILLKGALNIIILTLTLYYQERNIFWTYESSPGIPCSAAKRIWGPQGKRKHGPLLQFSK
jgi:hypothetical protein